MNRENTDFYTEEKIDVTNGVTSIKFIKTKNLIRYGNTITIVSNEEREFLLGLFKKHLNGLHKNKPFTHWLVYQVVSDIKRFYSDKLNIEYIIEDYVFGKRPYNDLYFTYGFKINTELISTEDWKPFDLIQYVLRYIDIIYGLPKSKFDNQIYIKVMTRETDTIIGI